MIENPLFFHSLPLTSTSTSTFIQKFSRSYSNLSIFEVKKNEEETLEYNDISDKKISVKMTKETAKIKNKDLSFLERESVAFTNDDIVDLCDVTKILVTDYNR